MMGSDFEIIYADNYRNIFSFLYKLCQNSHVAEELTQETFYQAYISIHKFKGQCSMFTWLAAIAKNQFFKYLRKSNNEAFLIDLYISQPDNQITEEPGYRLFREVDINRVREAIASLPDKYSEILILRIYAELPYEEISKKLGISVNSAKVIFYRAKNIIKEKLIND